MSSNLSYLIYVSTESRPLSQNDIDNILKASKVNNPGNQITGMLLYVEGRFFQVLEGAETALNDLFITIAKDERHINSIVVAKGDLDKRIFKDWKMKFNSISEKEFVIISGISKFQNLFGLKPKDSQNPASLFMRKFVNKKFPSESWWIN
jgi:hypothetical protein